MPIILIRNKDKKNNKQASCGLLVRDESSHCPQTKILGLNVLSSPYIQHTYNWEYYSFIQRRIGFLCYTSLSLSLPRALLTLACVAVELPNGKILMIFLGRSKHIYCNKIRKKTDQDSNYNRLWQWSILKLKIRIWTSQ